MKTNRITLFLLSCLLTIATMAQDLATAIKLTQSERFEDASQAYKKLVNADTKGDVYFYYADNFLAWQEEDSAKAILEKGITINAANPMLYAGLAKVAAVQEQRAEVNKNLAKASELIKTAGNSIPKEKQAVVYQKMAEAHLLGSGKNPDEAIRLLREAEKLNPKDPEIYVLLGDAYLEKNVADASESIRNYEKAYELDKSSLRAILRQGQLYTRVSNFEEALKFYKQALQIDPNFAPAYRERAELYYKFGKVAEGIADYQKYLELNNSATARSRYAVFLYVAKEYQSAIEQAQSALAAGITNPVLFRVLGYSNYELKNYSEGLQNLEKFMTLAQKEGKPKIIMLDYSYYGKLLAESGNDSLGVNHILQAMKIDPNYVEGYGDIASIYFKQKNYPESVKYYKLKLEKTAKPDYNDYNFLGRALYLNKEYGAADSAFMKLTEVLPNNVIGYLWRAKSKNKIDNPENPALAKPFYEKVVELGLADPEKNKKDLIEAYSYLGFHYFVNKDYSCSKAAWLKVKELDPANEKALKALGDKEIAAGGECELIKKQQP